MYEEEMPELELDSGRFVYIGRGPKARRIAYTLRQLRHTLGRTQQELAASAGIAQSELSRLEKRHDLLISTLQRYIEGLGASLEIHAIVKGKRVRLV